MITFTWVSALIVIGYVAGFWTSRPVLRKIAGRKRTSHRFQAKYDHESTYRKHHNCCGGDRHQYEIAHWGVWDSVACQRLYDDVRWLHTKTPLEKATALNKQCKSALVAI